MRTVALGLTLMLAAAGCAVGAEESASGLDLRVDLSALAIPDAVTQALDPDALAVSAFLVRDNRLVSVARELEDPSSSALLDSVVDYAIAGPTTAEARSGIWSAIPPQTMLLGTRLQAGVAEINLSSDFAAIGGTDEVLAVAQIVLTVTALADTDSVVFLLDGTPTSVPGAGGVLVSGPLEEDEYRELLSK
jgi:hypothetical protein